MDTYIKFYRSLRGLAPLLLSVLSLSLWSCAGVEPEQMGLCVGVGCDESRPCVEGERRCLDNQPQTCIGEGQWGKPRHCDGQCINGSCQIPCPLDTCVPGTVNCTPEGLQTCERREDGCGSWSAPEACPAGQRCREGSCQDACPQICQPGDLRCGSTHEVQECQQRDGCWVFAGVESCGAGTICSDGACRAPELCEDACQEGTFQCQDSNLAQRCERQASGCLDWSEATLCDLGQSCRPGLGCTQSCAEECSARALRCKDGGVQQCQFDADGCRVWGAINACAPGEVCEDGACFNPCPGACELGAVRCGPTGREICEVSDGCPRFVSDPCPSGKPCLEGGQCGDCQPGSVQEESCGRCGTRSRTCGQDGRWGEYGSCGAQGTCSPGEQRACGNCGRQTCSNQCEWSSCSGQGVCAAGSQGACGTCGYRDCNAQCQWTTSSCKNDGTKWQHCNSCGWQFCCSGGDWCPCAAKFACSGGRSCVGSGVCQ